MTINRQHFEQWLETNDFEESRRRHSFLRESSEKGIDDAIMDPEVRAALRDLASLGSKEKIVVIGGTAFGVYAKPRYTEGIDILVSSESDVSKIALALSSKFKSIRPHALEHKKTGVSVEIVTPGLVGISKSLVDDAIKSSHVHVVGDAFLRVVSAKSMIALKLGRAVNKGARAMQDRADIMAVLTTTGYHDLSDLGLPENEISLYNDLWNNVEDE